MWLTDFLSGLGLFRLLAWLGPDHVASLATRLALVMALWMVKDIRLPNWGPATAAPHATRGWMQRAMERGGLAGICTVPCSGAIYLDIVAVLHASGGRATGLALLALYNLAYIAPLVALLAAVSNRLVLGTMGRWNRANSPWVKAAIAFAVVAMSLALMITL